MRSSQAKNRKKGEFAGDIASLERLNV